MIFNKTKKGSAELYNLTGTWYKANDFTGISEDIVLAQNEVIKLIGKATFDRAHSRYMTDEYDPEVSSDDPEDMLVRRVQLPVAYKAMHHFYQRNLVSHEDSGRKVKISENEKLPWAWQIEKDDAVLRDTFFRTLDELYLFLEQTDIKEWKDSPLRTQQQQSILRTLDQFESIYPLDGSFYTFYTLIPFILEVQQRFVRPIAGDRYMSLLSDIDSDIGISQRFADSFQGKGAGKTPSTDALKFYLSALDHQAATALEEFHEALSATAEKYSLLPDNDPRNKFFSVQ